MKNLFQIALLAVALLVTPAVITGCQTTTTTTAEAAKYYTLRDTWNTSLAIYRSYAELAVQGKVSLRDQQDIDRAWNAFRVGIKLALSAAQNDWSAVTPEGVDALRNNLIILIRSL